MTLRITTREALGKLVLSAAGKLAGEEVGEFAIACEEASRPLVIDLGQVDCADESGLRLLRKLAASGIELRGASPYLTLLLETDSP